MTHRTILPLGLLAIAGGIAAADSTTIDIRALGGLANGNGSFAAVNLASTAYGGAGRFGPGDSALVGLAGALRLQVSTLEAESGGQTSDVDLTGGELGIGFGMWLSRPITVEVLARFGAGFSSSRGGVSFDGDDGDYTMWGVVVSGEYTFENQVQVALEAGFSRYELSFKDSSGKHTGDGDGVDLGLGVGYRF